MAPSLSSLALIAASLLLLLLPAVQSSRLLQQDPSSSDSTRRELELVPDQPLVLTYHGGKVLGGGHPALNVYILWYGAFTRPQRAIIHSFVQSISSAAPAKSAPSVRSWWKLTSAYTDATGAAPPATVHLAGHASDSRASLGKNLKESDLPLLVQRAVAKGVFPADPAGLYFVLTAADVRVEKFCMNQCGTHSAVSVGKQKLAWAWVGNSATQCPGTCAWPFAPLPFPGAPPKALAKAPNGDVGLDGMVINVAAMLAGAGTNPFGDAFYQGDALAPLEAGTACPGVYGAGAYPGYPGALLTNKATGGNFNVYGYKKRRFVVPSLVSRATAACAVSA